jgi:hypothetical protein
VSQASVRAFNARATALCCRFNAAPLQAVTIAPERTDSLGCKNICWPFQPSAQGDTDAISNSADFYAAPAVCPRQYSVAVSAPIPRRHHPGDRASHAGAAASGRSGAEPSPAQMR